MSDARPEQSVAGRSLRQRIPGTLQRADLAAFRWVARRHASPLDVALPTLSRAANHGRLWVVVAALLAATGGRFGRRAAVRGLLALSATSATVNLPVKLAARRERPEIHVVPHARRLARLPTSTSFPSGHAASAAAFATGAAAELPAVRTPLRLLAAAVAASRVYTGVHYPGDVLAGAAIGVGMAVGSRRLWPLTPRPGQEESPPGAPLPAAPLPRGDGLVVVANASAGPALSSDPVTELRRRLPATRLREVERGENLQDVMNDAAAHAEVLGVAGGDGSVSAAAVAAAERGLSLAVVPAGTLNHLARDLGIAGPGDTAAALATGQRVAVDVAELDGTVFCNAVCLGGYRRFVDVREGLQPRVGDLLARLLALLWTWRTTQPVHLELNGARRSVWMVFIGNCRFEREGFAPGWRRRLDDELLDVRIIRADRRLGRLRFLLAAVTGTLARSSVYERTLHRRLRIRSADGPLHATRDGEPFDVPAECTVTKRAGGLSVYAPQR